MLKVKFVGKTCMVLNGQFIYPGETREIEESLFERITRERPGLLEVAGTSPLATLPEGEGNVIGNDEAKSTADEAVKVEAVADDNSVEHVDQPTTRRRGRAK